MDFFTIAYGQILKIRLFLFQVLNAFIRSAAG